jgi:hypothetical protein
MAIWSARGYDFREGQCAPSSFARFTPRGSQERETRRMVCRSAPTAV